MCNNITVRIHLHNMSGNYYASVFCNGHFGCLKIGSKSEVKRVTNNFTNMNPVLVLSDSSKALVIGIHGKYNQ